MAAALAEGETVLENAAMEPEIIDLAEMLIKMGGAHPRPWNRRITIESALHRTTPVVPTALKPALSCAPSRQRAVVLLNRARSSELLVLILGNRRCGRGGQRLACSAGAGSKARELSFTTEYPGFPTDMQAQFSGVDHDLNGAALGDRRFENHFMHVNELLQIWASDRWQGRWSKVSNAAVGHVR